MCSHCRLSSPRSSAPPAVLLGALVFSALPTPTPQGTDEGARGQDGHTADYKEADQEDGEDGEGEDNLEDAEGDAIHHDDEAGDRCKLLAESCNFMSESLKRLARDPSVNDLFVTLSDAQRAFSEAGDMANQFHNMATNTAEAERADELLTTLITNWVARVKLLKVNELMMCPSGWRRPPDGPEGRDGPNGACGAVLHVLKRQENSYSFACINVGEGCEYHACKAAPETGQIRRNSFFSFNNIPINKLADGSFWFFLWRQLVYPAPTNGPSMLYETLMPYLNQVRRSDRQLAVNSHLN